MSPALPSLCMAEVSSDFQEMSMSEVCIKLSCACVLPRSAMKHQKQRIGQVCSGIAIGLSEAFDAVTVEADVNAGNGSSAQVCPGRYARCQKKLHLSFILLPRLQFLD